MALRQALRRFVDNVNPIAKVNIAARMPRTAELIGVLVICLGVVFLLYHGLLRIEEVFQGGDDLRNHQISLREKNSLRTILDFTFFSGNSYADTYYMPFHWLLHYLLNRTGHATPLNFRIYILLLHGLNGVVLYYLAGKLLSLSKPLSLISALLFFSCQNLKQAVVWLTPATVHTLCLFFILSSILCYHRFRQDGSPAAYVLCLTAFVGAWLAKESAVFLLFVLFAYDIGFLPHTEKAFQRGMRSFRALSPMVVIQGAMLAISKYRYAESSVSKEWGGFYFGVNTIYKFFDFLKFLMIPLPLPGELNLFLHLAVFLALLAAILYGGKETRFLVFWIAISIVPFLASNFRPVAHLSRYLYYASAPFSLLLIYVPVRYRRACPMACYAFLLFIVLFELANFGGLTLGKG